MAIAVTSVAGLGLAVTQSPMGMPVTAVASGGLAVTPVAAGGLPVFDTAGTLFGPAVIPANTGLPVITGVTQVGNTLLTSSGTWSGTTATYTYQWKRGGVNIAGATSSSYLLVTADLGATITVTVTATNTAGSASATSAGVGPVTAASAGPGVPTIDLAAVSDAGSSSTDNITRINTPVFDIICATTPVVGDVIDIAKNGTIAASATLTATDISGVTAPGLGVGALADGTYSFTARHTNAGGTSAYSSALSVTIDTVVPVLTSVTGAQNGTTQSSADLSVTTNKGQGIIYWVVLDAAATAPSAAQIILGQDGTGTNVASGRSGSIPVSSTGVKTATATGFSVTGSLKNYFTQTDVAGNIAAVPTPATWTQTIAGFTANGVGGFDASTTYLTNTALAGSIPAGQKGLISFWIKVAGGLGTDRYLCAIGPTLKLWVTINTSNVLQITGRDAGGVSRLGLQIGTAGNPFTSLPTAWIHAAIWWDLSLGTPAGQIWLNGALNTSTTKTLDATSPISYNQTIINVGAGAANTLKWNGSMSEVYINLHETLDLSNPANLAKFIAGGNPVSLGANGSTPTGTQPEFYLGGSNNNTNWQNNLGTKGNFTVPAGALTSVTGPP